MDQMYFFSYVDYIPYVFLFLSLIFCCIMEYAGHKKSVNIAFLILFIFSSIRYDVGWDFIQYENFVAKGQEYYDYERFEWLNKILFAFLNYIGINQLYFIVTSFAILYPVYKLSKIYSSYPTLSLFLFASIPLFYFPSLSTIRNSLAFSIIFVAIHYCITKQYIKYLLAILISTGIHNSSYFGLLIPVITFFPQKRNICIGVFILSLFVSNFVSSFIMSLTFDNHILKRAQAYIEYFGSTQGDSLKYLIYIMCGSIFVFWNKIESNESDKIFLNFITLGACLFFMFYFDGSMSQRFSVFFIQCFILIIPRLIENLQPENRIQMFSAILVLGVMLSFYYLNQFVVGYENGEISKISYLPYRIFFLEE